MAVFIACLVLFLAMTGHSSAASYCVCKDGVSDQILQKNIDYACGAGADCTQITQNGPCYNPNTIKDHCNYAVNSYYQRKSEAVGSCDFQGTATVSPTPPSNAASGCVYPSSPSTGGGSTSTPSTNPTTAPPGTIAPPGTTNPTTAPPGTTNPITTPVGGSTTSPGFGLGPSGSGFGNPDNTGSDGVSVHQDSNLLTSLALTLFISGLVWLRV